MRRMKLASALAVCLVLCACTALLADNPKIINLNTSEKAQALSLLEHRQAIFFKRQKLEAQYQADVHRLDEEMNGLNIEAGQLCFAMKKAHAIPPNVSYQLDEVNARLVKQ